MNTDSTSRELSLLRMVMCKEVSQYGGHSDYMTSENSAAADYEYNVGVNARKFEDYLKQTLGGAK